MRFREDGANIPDELIRAVAAGEVVFLCGAGVSKRAGFPLFRQLTDDIYLRLGETRDHDPAERLAFADKEYDRVLRSLEKRTRVPGKARSRVREEAARQLQAPEGVAFPDHLALLKLSRDSDGRPKLLTTNFDTLFERAASQAEIVVQSHAGKSLPKPGGPRDHGVLHLHGRIADKGLDLDDSDLILTSADFGDAYLRDGWASRYIEDRMRLGVLLLVGYQAEDAALRLLLETLDADREHFPDLRDIYAIDRVSDDSASVWKAKGIKPIEFASFDAIYDTLAEWVRFASRPVETARERVATILTKPPGEATEFELEQLRFFIGFDDPIGSLVAINPSLAWLPMLAQWQLIKHDERRLAGWIQQNFSEAQAVRDIVASLDRFGPEAADALEYRLRDHAERLPPLLTQCWRLLVRHMKVARQGLTGAAWFDLGPRVQAGETTHELLQRVAEALRPQLKIAKRFTLREDRDAAPQRPSDLMSIDYEVEEDITADEVIAAWPETASAEAYASILNYLLASLDAALADATDVGVESSNGYGMSDSEVPSVADHAQNTYRSGFLPIVRVIADLWLRLARKDQARALSLVTHWRDSVFRLNHRLALFAATDRIVPADVAADLLIALPQGELFLTQTTVEVFRLLRTRWTEIPQTKREAIEQRLRTGPPVDWFREGADVRKYVDRTRFDVLGRLQADGLALHPDSEATLRDIRTRWPEWVLRPAEQAGFHSWHESSQGEVGDPTKLSDVPIDRVVAEAKSLDDAAPFGNGDSWRALCLSDPEKTLRGLEAEAAVGRWPEWAWRTFLWAQTDAEASARNREIGQLLLACPVGSFGPDIAGAAAYWLNKGVKAMDEDLLWPLWDRILAAPSDSLNETGNGDLLTSALNAPIGRLAEILLQRMPPRSGDDELDDLLRARLNRLISSPGFAGRLARVRLAAEVSLLFERAPVWVAENILPLFDWASAEALAVWSARKYSSYLGSEELFDRLRKPFLEMFGRSDVPAEDLRIFAEWLVAVLIANQAGKSHYSLTASEARAALRRTGITVLPSVAHRLAVEMKGAAPEQKVERWRAIVRPVFEGMWPLDIELQDSSSTFALVHLLRASGDVFGEAAEVIIPFVRPDPPNRSPTLYSLANADEALFALAPASMLDLIAAVVGEPTGRVHSLRKALDKVQAADARLANIPKFQSLLRHADP